MTLREPLPDQKVFENTFAPDTKNKTLSVHDVILGLKTMLLFTLF